MANTCTVNYASRIAQQKKQTYPWCQFVAVHEKTLFPFKISTALLISPPNKELGPNE
jgi:hypothetical protein